MSPDLTRIDTCRILRHVSTAPAARRAVPAPIWKLPLGERIRWARKAAKLSHDRLADALGRSNRGHLIKIERGTHVPRAELREAIADATNVPRELFADGEDEDDEADPVAALFAKAVRAAVRAELEAATG